MCVNDFDFSSYQFVGKSLRQRHIDAWRSLEHNHWDPLGLQFFTELPDAIQTKDMGLNLLRKRSNDLAYEDFRSSHLHGVQTKTNFNFFSDQCVQSIEVKEGC